MLDWEMQQEGNPVTPIFLIPNLNPDEQIIYANIQSGNNYSYNNRINHINLEVYSCFLAQQHDFPIVLRIFFTYFINLFYNHQNLIFLFR